MMVISFDESFWSIFFPFVFYVTCFSLFGYCIFFPQICGVLAQVKTEKDLVEALVQPVENADRIFQEIEAQQKQVEDLEYKLDFRGPGVRTLEEIQLELNALQTTK